MSSKSAQFYIKDVADYLAEKAKQIAEMTFKYEFWATQFGGTKKYFANLKTDDIITELKEKKPQGVTVKQWSPLKHEAFSANHLEKGMHMRYSSNNMVSAYVIAAGDSGGKAGMIKEFDKQVFTWESTE